MNQPLAAATRRHQDLSSDFVGKPGRAGGGGGGGPTPEEQAQAAGGWGKFEACGWRESRVFLGRKFRERYSRKSLHIGCPFMSWNLPSCLEASPWKMFHDVPAEFEFSHVAKVLGTGASKEYSTLYVSVSLSISNCYRYP